MTEETGRTALSEQALNILFVSPEVFPFARAGGLGDVSHYLPQALAGRGHRLWVVTPCYRGSEDAGFKLKRIGPDIRVPLSWREQSAQFYSARIGPGRGHLRRLDELYDRPGSTQRIRRL
jgi:glycogen synthase